MNKLFEKTGVMALGTRLRMLSERVTKDSEKIFSLYNVDIKPKWYPVIFSLLESNKTKTITEIAEEIGHSHVSVIKIVKEMSKEKMLIETKNKNDARKTDISLSALGRKRVEGLNNQHRDVTIAMEAMISKMQNNLWDALDEFDQLLDEESTYPRVLKEQRKRESSYVEIVDYEEKYKKDFQKINKDWIDKYFKMEEKDILSLENPKEYILDKGGYILVVLYKQKVVGVCALIKSQDDKYDYELAKMGIITEYQGLGIGLLLGNAIINKAKELGAKSIFLDSNTILEPAINLYRKLGFKKVIGYSNSYERTNIKMQLNLKD